MTAVEFLLSHMWTTDWVNYTREEKLEVIEEAKQMEKDQIMDAFTSGEVAQGYEDEAKDYYNQTYGSQDNKTIASQEIKISDEEIDKASKEHFIGGTLWSERVAFKLAIKWYRDRIRSNN